VLVRYRHRGAGLVVDGVVSEGRFSHTTRDVIAVDATYRGSSLIIVPTDWFVSGGASVPKGT